MSTSLTLAWRYLGGRKMRTALTTLAVVFGVATFFGLNGMMPAALDALQRNLFATAGKVDLTVTNTSSGMFDPSIAEKVVRVEGIAAVTPSLRLPLSLPPGGPVGSVTVVGIDPTSASRVRSYPISSGRFLGPGDRVEVALGEDLAAKLGVRVGSQVVLPGVSGTTRFRVIGILALPSTPGAEEVFMTLPDSRALFGTGAQVNTVEAAYKNGADRAYVESQVKRAIGSQYQTGGIESGSQLLASMKIGEFALNMFGVFALVMGAFIILNTFRTVVAERRHDIGMLRAIGASRSTILSMFLVESMLQGILGTLAGLILGWGFAWGIVASMNPMYKKMLNFEIPGPKFTTETFIAAIVMGIGFTIVGALGPAIGAARLTPLEALRPPVADVDVGAKHRWAWLGWSIVVGSLGALLTNNANLVGLASVTFLAGLVIVAPSLIGPLARVLSRLVGLVFRAEGDLARSNLERQPTRAATTASAIMMSLAIVIALLGVLASIFVGFLSYLDKSLGSDFIVLPRGLIMGGGHIGADQAFVDRIASTPGVGDVATLRYTQASADGSAIGVIGIDPKTYLKLATFEWSEGSSDADIAKLSHGRNAIVNGISASQRGIQPGSRLQIDTPNGAKTYTIVAVGSDYLNAKLATVYTSQENLLNDFAVGTSSLVLVDAAQGANFGEVKRLLTLTMASYPQFALYDSASFKQSQFETINQSMVMMYALVAVLALPTLLALLNTLLISVLARTREIGMLRAVGSTRRQVHTMVLAESLLLATIGVVFGVAGGLVMSYSLVRVMQATAFVMPFIFPTTGIVVGVIIGYTFAWLAAWWPARQAGRLDIVAALHYE